MSEFMSESTALPLWEQQILAEDHMQANVSAANNGDNLPSVSDPKDARRAVYQGRGRARQDHGTRGQETIGSRDVREARRYDYRFKLSLMPTDDEMIGESLDSVVEPEMPDWSHMDWLDDDGTDGPAPIYYDGPYNPEKEARRKDTEMREAIDKTQERSVQIFEQLSQQTINNGEALRQLVNGVYGSERERLQDMISEYMGGGSIFEFVDPSAEFGVLMGAGNLATRQTLDMSPYDDADYLEGFHVFNPR